MKSKQRIDPTRFEFDSLFAFQIRCTQFTTNSSNVLWGLIRCLLFKFVVLFSLYSNYAVLIFIQIKKASRHKQAKRLFLWSL
ncbi:hypothetical protein BGP_1638 [Beggiatoa sp. PS]|nr:hypothetical protein BGP_1638 [Beggiatoa sp. PS]